MAIISQCSFEYFTILVPSTMIPSTYIPSTLIPSTQIPSTQLPSTQIPSTQIDSTVPPQTTNPPTQIPSTQIPSTQVPSSQIPSTQIPSNQIDSTVPPQTTNPPTSLASSQIPSTQVPSNTSCSYNVPNCLNCENGNPATQVDPNLFNISCIFVSNKWIYSFKNKTSNTVTISNDLVFEKQSNIYIDGNFNQDSSSKITFFISFQNNKKKQNNNNNASIDVNGCISLNGNIDLVLDERPSSNQQVEIDLISYNCNTLPSLSESQVRLQTNYPNNQCDSVTRNINNQPNTLSVSLSSTLNKNCRKIFPNFKPFYF